MIQWYGLYMSLCSDKFVILLDCSVGHFVSWCSRFVPNLVPVTDMQHYDDVIMNTMASQITSLTIVYSTIYSGADQSKHQSSASLAFVWVIHRGPVNSPHKWPVTRKLFPFDDVIMASLPYWRLTHDKCFFYRDDFPWLCFWQGCIIIFF